MRRPRVWLRRFFFAAIACVAVAAGGVYYAVGHADELLREAVLTAVAAAVPEAGIDLAAARFDWKERVTLEDVALSISDEPTLLIPSAVIDFDRAASWRDRKLRVRRIVLAGPRLRLLRDVEGRWAVEPLLARLPAGDGPPPDLVIEDGTLDLVLERPLGGPVVVTLHDADVTVVPDADGRMTLTAGSHVADGPRLDVGGWIDSSRGTWSVNGRADGVDTSGPLTALAFAYDPSLAARVASWDRRLGRPSGKEIRTVSADDVDLSAATVAADAADNALPLGVAIEADVEFAVGLPDPAAAIVFDVRGDARAGELVHPSLPFPLSDVSGRIRVSNDGLRVTDLVGRHGTGRLSLDGSLAFPGVSVAPPVRQAAATDEVFPDAIADRFEAGLDDVVLSPEVIALVPGGAGEVLRGLDPDGTVDLRLAVVRDGPDGPWRLDAFRLDTADAAVRPRPFPLRVEGVSGHVELVTADRLEVVLRGRADGLPVTCVGAVVRRGDGPGEVEAAFNIAAAEAALTPAVATACPPAAREVFRRFALEAAGAVELTLYRPPVSLAPLQWTLTADVRDGRVRHESFPYPLTGLTGRVTYDAVSGRWAFENLAGRRGPVSVTAKGECLRHESGHSLAMEFDAAAVPLDRTLFASLTPELQMAWRHLRPGGTLAGKVGLTWETGRPVVITLPSLRWTGGTLNSVGFPYRISRVDADLAYRDGVVTVGRFSGRHGETTIDAGGRCLVGTPGRWEMRIESLDVDGLRADDDLKRAVGPALREFLVAANPRGPLALDGAMAFRGRADSEAVAAAWDLSTRFAGADWTLGLELSDTAGVVRCRGDYDGVDARFDGSIDLDHVTLLEQRAVNVRGPFRYRGGRLVVGSPRVFGLASGSAADIPAAERVTGELIGGAWTVDALLEPSAGGKSYAVRSTLSGGRLRDYTSLAGVETLRGVVNGWIDLRGTVPPEPAAGVAAAPATIDGRGQVEISPAALYELPVLVETFKVLNFRPPDRTAFHFAFADFRIDEGGFVFDTIDLVGDAISMRGRGTAGWNERLDLLLYSFMPQQRFTVPVIGELWNRATAGWVGVEVGGTVSNPVQRVVGAPVLNDAVRGFLDSFDPTRREPPVLDLEGLPTSPAQNAARRGARGWSGGVTR